jgi:hypothetical protein
MNHIVRLYTDFAYGVSKQPSTLVPIVWAQIDNVTDDERSRRHHRRATCFQLVTNPENADWFVLPNTWNVYVREKAIPQAKAFAALAQQYQKLVLVWAGGDPEYIVPLENAIQVQEGLHKGIARKAKFAFERPGFVEDIVAAYRNDQWQPVIYTKKPIVGFVGMARASLLTRLHFLLTNQVDKLKLKINRATVLPSQQGFPLDIRHTALMELQRSREVETSFIIRGRYKAGISGDMAETKSRKEFVDNIFESMYVVCVRGGGNFSKRFYETLCCGRIPILVDTNSMLPFDEFIDWDDYLVRVHWQDLKSIGRLVANFHDRLSPQGFIDLQIRCRQLWKEWLKVESYYKQFPRYLSVTASKLQNQSNK